MNPPAFLRSRAWRLVVLAAHLALIAVLPMSAGVFGVALTLPLLAVAPGLWRAAPRAYAGASLLLVFYAGGGLMEAYATPARFAAGITFAAIAGVEFCALILFVRVRAAELRNRASAA